MPIFLLNTKQGRKEVVPFLGNYHVRTEWPLLERKIDVAILDSLNNPLLLIEVLNKNKVSKEKSMDIIQYPWVEITAKSVLENQRTLKVERHHRFPQEYDYVSQLSLDL
jgi:hypothetical protein